MTRVCRVCLRELPLTAFYEHPLARHGREAQCKECRKRARRLRYQRDLVEQPEKVARWQERSVAAQRARYQTDPDFRQRSIERLREYRGKPGPAVPPDYTPPPIARADCSFGRHLTEVARRLT